MTRLIFHARLEEVPRQPDDAVHVWLYGSSPPFAHVGVVGHQVLDVTSRLTVQPSVAAMDFVTLALAVTAADTFVLRDDAPDGWSRSFDIVVPLIDPAAWLTVKAQLEHALRFLSSDTWSFTFVEGGVRPPTMSEIKRKRAVVNLSQVDCVSLFSGGLDSAIGAIELLQAGKRPLLVSHAPHKDADRQDKVAALLPARCERMSVNTYPTWSGVDDDSMRTRSFQFLALGALGAEAVATFRGMEVVDLYVCENGFIALNPPLTPRRIGAHSTRTAHPYFLGNVAEVMNAVNLPVKIRNPYAHMTKGEMVGRFRSAGGFDQLAVETVSCGKWKRKNEQCGRCVPCLIRRASFHAGQVVDRTCYTYPDLHHVMTLEDGRDDLVSVQSAIIRESPLERAVVQAGPLPETADDRGRYFDVARRGMAELANYLRACGFAL